MTNISYSIVSLPQCVCVGGGIRWHVVWQGEVQRASWHPFADQNATQIECMFQDKDDPTKTWMAFTCCCWLTYMTFWPCHNTGIESLCRMWLKWSLTASTIKLFMNWKLKIASRLQVLNNNVWSPQIMFR